MPPQITVLDAGGQYCHLIARKVRDLGVYAEVAPSEIAASELTGRKGVIISGGPSSVFDAGSPSIDPRLLHGRTPVLGICYGHQLIAHLLGGQVEKGERGEYGFAQLEVVHDSSLFTGIEGPQQVWMSHRDVVARPPTGFDVLARTGTCAIAAMGSAETLLYAVQFHPEVAHTPSGKRVLSNFLFNICGCERDWNPTAQIRDLEEQVRATARERGIFFFVSGGVDSTVAYTLCLRALGPERVRGTYVDTGLMRERETEFVRENFEALGARGFQVEDASSHFLTGLADAIDPEHKREVIGEEFVRVQERILETEHFLNGHWILGQGTIYPDTIESGGTAKADLIKTHHNRVPGIQKLMGEGRIVEPLSSFYKDEVRAIGRELGLPATLLERHPFPGPGLAIRCLCSMDSGWPEKSPGGWVLPVRSVGVQGDSRTYRATLAIDDFPATADEAAHLVNTSDGVNRVIVIAGATGPVREMRSSAARLSRERLARLRRADAIVRHLSHASGFDQSVWQFPVVLIPFGTPDRPDSVVLRPIDSVDGMTANAVRMPKELLEEIVRELTRVDGIAGVFYDFTNKPPATIEWE
ncbi:MAG: glutamine-hydrolyzing GMP synthase [Bryobacterales bacterium]|nr:glutamine-hydrolyzing GMP synthase [Bryobacterales bacterium]MBV9401655.1 glutamine-hydrolyzing GMP synthase [Bryobacterales bacterium]